MNRTLPMMAALALGLTACSNANALKEQDALSVIQAYQGTYPKENRQCQQGYTAIAQKRVGFSAFTQKQLDYANMLADAGLLTKEAPQMVGSEMTTYFTTTPAFERDFAYGVFDNGFVGNICSVNYRAEKVNKVSVDGDIATVTTISKDDGTTPWNQNAELVKALGIPAVKTDAIQVFTLVKSGDTWNVQSVQNQ